jgi:hypothetical protein
MPQRFVVNTELVDVAPVNMPAYPDATASARAFDDDLIHSLARLKECSPAEVRSYLNEAGNVAKFFKRSDVPSAIRTEEPEMTTPADNSEDRAVIKKRGELPDSVFAYIEPGHDDEKVDGRTPDKYRHFPLTDENHIRNALSQAPKSPFGDKAMPKIKAAAKKHGIEVSEQNSLILASIEEIRIMFADMFDDDEETRGDLPPWLQKAKDKKDGKDDDDSDDDDKSDSKKSDAKPEKKSDEQEAEDRAKGNPPMDGSGDNPAEDDEEDDDEESVRAAIEAEHQEMRDRLLRHEANDFDPYDGLEG